MSGTEGAAGDGHFTASAGAAGTAELEPAATTATPGAGEVDVDGAVDDDDDEVIRTSSRVSNRARPSNLMLLLGAILVATIANVVVAWLVLGSTTQVRDQYTVANGLQRCLIRAQLNANSTTDPNGTVYKTAVLACINR